MYYLLVEQTDGYCYVLKTPVYITRIGICTDNGRGWRIAGVFGRLEYAKYWCEYYNTGGYEMNGTATVLQIKK